ncbi:MAG: GGDEF domain-containing protein [Clostridiales bacterium]|nr:GGDEF domain-containing protein [Clostridiales bacterium]
MDTTLNLTSVFGTDFAGVILLLVILLTKGWSLPARKKESRIILMMIVLSVFNCLCDALTALLDGRTGFGIRVILLTGNTYLYLYNLIVGISIIYLVVQHIDKTVPKLQVAFFAVLGAVEVTLLICNIFKPLVFSLDENNVYQRGPYYMVFLLAGFVLIFYGYTYYFVSKIQNPALRYFPVWQFLSPIVLAVVIQTALYGVSLLPVGFAIAFVSLVICLQNECIYIDKLTGVYNRYELDKFKKIFPKLKKEKIAAMMLDLNGFKAINDNFSHEEGDAALVAFADILVKVIRNDGLVMRFAGDEFIVIIRKCKDEDIGKYKERIKAAVDEYNETSGKPYPLSVSIGGDVFSYSPEESDFIAKIDQLMYTDKEKYYKEHPKQRGVPAKEIDQ